MAVAAADTRESRRLQRLAHTLLDELYKIVFTRRSSELKSTRRARIRQLVRLSRLTEAHSIETLGDPASRPHAELIGILRSLARRAR